MKKLTPMQFFAMLICTRAYLILTALNGVSDTPAFAIDSLYIGLAHIKRSVRTHTLGLKDLQ